MSPLLSAAAVGLSDRLGRVLRRGIVALAVTLSVNVALLWSLAELHRLGVVGKKKAPRKAVAVTRIERPKLRKKTTRRRRRARRQRSRRSALPALALPSSVQVPGFADSASEGDSAAVLHDKKALNTGLLADDQPLDESLVDTPPKALFSVSPVYPPRAQRQGLEGSVRLRLLVGSDGRVSRVVVLQAKPPGIFDRAAIAAARQLRFRPARLGSRVVRVWVRKTLSFKLR